MNFRKIKQQMLKDFNAKMRKMKRLDLVGEHCLGGSNDRGEMLFDFCMERAMVLTNTKGSVYTRPDKKPV